MKQKMVQPFKFLTEDQVRVELELLEEEKRNRNKKNEIIIVETGCVKRTIPSTIKNTENPFINFCKRAFDFVKENIKITITGMPFNTRLKVGDFIPTTEDKIKNLPLPSIKTTISAGPLEVEIDSEDVKSIADCIRKY